MAAERQPEDNFENVNTPIKTECPACNYHYAAPFLTDTMPLATIAWPQTAQESISMKRLPLDYVQCLSCTHVYNRSFKYEDVPYNEKPNLMYNKGAVWKGFIADLVNHFAKTLPQNARVVEIGHGDGSFLAALSKACPEGQFTGFDPNGAAQGSDNVTFIQDLFDPIKHFSQYKPDLIIMRHIIEHLLDPLAFLQSFSLAADLSNHETRLYIETPCIDRVLETHRTVDFYYEHVNQFTTKSFQALLHKAGLKTETCAHGYDKEVIYAHCRAKHNAEKARTMEEAHNFLQKTHTAKSQIKDQIKEYRAQKKSIAVWGGTGKSAAFINRYDLSPEEISIVVDSDSAKHGTFVPGTQHEIASPEQLNDNPADIIIIPPQWRAKDIVMEIKQRKINADLILIEHEGKLINFMNDTHPYQKPE